MASSGHENAGSAPEVKCPTLTKLRIVLTCAPSVRRFRQRGARLLRNIVLSCAEATDLVRRVLREIGRISKTLGHYS